MKCYYHPDIDSANACSACSRFLCPSCSHRVKGRIYCQDCLVQGAELAAIARSPQLANYSPSRAAFFGLVPGIGAVYNRQYLKAVTHFATFAALIILADHGPEIFGFAAFAFYVFTIIDAYRSAQSIMRAAAENPDSLRKEEEGEIKLPLWGVVLVLLGVFFFLDNLEVLRLRQVIDFAWPLIFIALGLYMILYYLTNPPKRRRPSASEILPPEAPPPYPPVSFESGGGESSATEAPQGQEGENKS